MKRLFFFFIASLLSLGMVTAQGTSTAHRFTLEDCLNYAMGNSYNRQSMKLSEDAQESAYQQSKMERLPSLNASLNESFTNSKSNSASWNGTYGLNTELPVYQGGSIRNTIEQSKLKTEQSSYQTSQYDNQLTIQILQAFLAVLGNEELLKYQDAVVKSSEEQVKQGKEQYRAGTILESDYLLLEAQYANDKNNITDTRIAREKSLLTLKSLLSMRPDVQLQIIYPDTSALVRMSVMPQMDHVMERTLATLPDLKISQYDVDIATNSVKLARSGYYPTVSLYGSVGTGQTNDYSNFGTQLSDHRNEQVGVRLSVPIFNNNRTKAQVTQSRIALQQAELNKKQTELDVLQNVTTEYQDVVSAFNKYQTTTILQNAYLKTFEAYSVQFNAGSITAVDLLQQQNNYISALNDYIQSKYGFMLKRKILDVYMGIPISM